MNGSTRTQVAIVGAGPAGLMLGHLLHLSGVESIVIESRSREYVERRVRAGVLEHGTAALLEDAGVGGRMRSEGLIHRGLEFQFDGRLIRIDLEELTGGKSVVVYGQQEVVRDLIAARVAADAPILFDCEVVAIDAHDGDRAWLRYRRGGEPEQRLDADFIAGCDGFHGVCRATIPAANLRTFDRVFPFAWLGILAESPPVSDELVYSNHERGFALFSMRSRSVSRLYLQCHIDEDLALWPDERIWAELRDRAGSSRGGPEVTVGPVVQKGVTSMRSFVCEPMRFGQLFLAGDSAHIVPPTGAKGLNLAIADVFFLARAIVAYYERGHREGLDAYSDTCLRRIWRTQRFSTYLTALLHRFDDHGPFERRVQLAELEHLADSRAAAQSLAESYVGLPLT